MLRSVSGLRVNIQFLKFQLGGGHTRPLVDKFEGIRSVQHPRTKSQVNSFIGFSGGNSNLNPTIPCLPVLCLK